MGKIRTKLGALGQSAGKALGAANKAVDKGIAGLGKFSDAIGIGAAVSVAGLGLALKDTITDGANFERTMVFAAAQFPGMIKQGTKEFQALQQAAMAVGDATEFSAQDAAEGLTLLATAGLSAEQAIAALPKVVNFATASKVEFSRASDIANDSMGAFSLKSQDAAKNAANMSRVMDVLTRAAADSTTNVEELFDAVKTGGPIAKTAGASLETFISYTEVLAGVGIKGSDAGTAIRNMFLELGAPSTAATKGMQKLGVTLARTKSGAIDMTATMGRFAKATAKMTKAQKIRALGDVFGARTIGPFIALMDAGVDVVGEFEKSLQQATGTTDGMAKELAGDTLGAFRQFDSLISGLKLDIFFAIKPVVLELVKATSDWVTANRELIKTKAAEWITEIRDNLPQIWAWTVRIAKAVAAFLVLAAAVKVLTTIFTIIGWISTAWAFIAPILMGTVIPAIAAVSLPVLAIGAAIAALVALLWAFWPEISEFFSGIADWAVETFARLWTATKDVFAKISAFVVASFEFIVGVLAVVLSPIIEFHKALWGAVAAIFVAAFQWIAQKAIGFYVWFLKVWEPIGAWFSGIWEGVKTSFFDALSWVVQKAQVYYAQFLKVWEPIKTWFSGIWQSIADGFQSLVGPIIDKVSGLIDKARKIGRGVLGTETAEDKATGEPAPQVVSPQARAASEAADASANASVDGKITVEAAPGTKATVRAKPRTVPINLQPSGAF